MINKVWLYILVIPLITHLMSAININSIFKKNKIIESRIIYLIIIFIVSYLLVNFLNEFIPINNF